MYRCVNDVLLCLCVCVWCMYVDLWSTIFDTLSAVCRYLVLLHLLVGIDVAVAIYMKYLTQNHWICWPESRIYRIAVPYPSTPTT